MSAVQAESALMPAAFIGHGSPMNALELNRYTAAWQALGRALPRPRAVLCISAHWYINATAVTVMARPRTIHDFFGFPQALFEVEYPAPGLPDLYGEIAELVKPHWVGADADSWGLDHGTWSVLVHLFPDASVPVVQLSINADKDFDYHLGLGRQLAGLRRRGVFVVGSGNIVHNLRAVDWELGEDGYDWARRFDAEVTEQVRSDPGAAPRLSGAPDFRAAAPTPDHFIPLLHFAGMASDTEEAAEVLVAGTSYGSISMTAYTLGIDGPEDVVGAETADQVPNVPADETNL